MPAKQKGIDIRIQKCKKLKTPSLTQKLDINLYSGTKDKICILRPNIIYIELINGKEIRYKPLCEIDNVNLSVFLLNIPMGYLLFQANNFVLHASAIEINQKGVLFCGFSKSGKSTTVDYMLKYGKMISEDVCMLKTINRNLFVSRSFPGIKIDKEHKESFDNSYENLIGNRNRIFQEIDSKKFSIDEITPVKKIIILDWNDNESMKSLKGTNLFKSILPHLFKIPFSNDNKKIFSDPVSEKKQLKFFSNFSNIEIFKYQRPNNNKMLYLDNLKKYIMQ